jgi:hypothetical protein
MKDNLAREDLKFNEGYCDTGPSEIEVMRQHITEEELKDLYSNSPYKDVRFKAGLALGYGVTHISAHEITHHPVDTYNSIRHR